MVRRGSSQGRAGSRPGTEPVRITTVAESPGKDIAFRQRRYLISMGIRTLCFVGAVLTGGWLRWVLVAAAFLLPYVAVVMANSAGPRIEEPDLLGPSNGVRELE